jgi:hypothetical protein
MRRREQKPPKRELGQVGSSTSRKPHSYAMGISKIDFWVQVGGSERNRKIASLNASGWGRPSFILQKALDSRDLSLLWVS